MLKLKPQSNKKKLEDFVILFTKTYVRKTVHNLADKNVICYSTKRPLTYAEEMEGWVDLDVTKILR